MDYEPLETVLGPNESKQIATTGGRPTDSYRCYFNVDRGGQSAIIALGCRRPGKLTETGNFSRQRTYPKSYPKLSQFHGPETA